MFAFLPLVIERNGNVQRIYDLSTGLCHINELIQHFSPTEKSRSLDSNYCRIFSRATKNFLNSRSFKSSAWAGRQTEENGIRWKHIVGNKKHLAVQLSARHYQLYFDVFFQIVLCTC